MYFNGQSAPFPRAENTGFRARFSRPENVQVTESWAEWQQWHDDTASVHG